AGGSSSPRDASQGAGGETDRRGFEALQRYSGARITRRSADRGRARLPQKGMPMTDTLMSSFRGLSACAIALTIIARCAAPPPPPPAPAPAAPAHTSARSFDAAVQGAPGRPASPPGPPAEPSAETHTNRSTG